MAGMKMHGRGRGAVPPMGKMKKGVLKRLMGKLFKNYKPLLITIAICLVISAITGSIAGLFLNTVYDTLSQAIAKTISVSVAWSKIITTLMILGTIYALGIVANFIYQQLGAVLTQRFLKDMRVKMFTKMERLPVKYFDTHTHGDIMSSYTNDIDALRQLISQSLPQACSTLITLTSLSIVMLYLSITLFIVVVVGLLVITWVTKTIGKSSAKYFMAQQKAVGKVEGYIEEMMNGQKVVKVFNHEEKAIEKFNELNGELFEVSNKANAFSNMLMPIIHNIGNVLYVLVAFIGGGIFIFTDGTGLNISFSALIESGSFLAPLKISVVVSFLGMARQFANITGQISNQINSVVMAMAGASRIFDLIDEKPEEDEGYVTLVKAKEDENGNLVETDDKSGVWAWKHPHKADGTVTYTRLTGDIRMFDVDFGYVPDHIVLHNVTLYAEPGQKIAFVG
ncbi:MAG: ABC transporter ATP-binding protein, partial [Clostridia bacterium]|nr:ABC transporter ATP-binding protein [Clostridia bacterium]